MLQLENDVLDVPTVLGHYRLFDTIGRGTYGTVRMALDTRTQTKVAIKIVQKSNALQPADKSSRSIQKEIIIHSGLPAHDNIVQFGEALEDRVNYYLVMEFAAGGELFDKIEPDIGFVEEVAHFYFIQLLNGIEIIHAQGAAHRDLKPENLLLDFHGNLKITDFGFSTVFIRPDGRRRPLQTRCGTSAYMAPELYCGAEYQGDAADMWSAAIVLFAMLVGCTPWDVATTEDEEFVRVAKYAVAPNWGPWDRIAALPRDLLYKMLRPNPLKRLIDIKEIRKHPWLRQTNQLISRVIARSVSPDSSFAAIMIYREEFMALTQPEIMHFASQAIGKDRRIDYFSQPEHVIDDLSSPSSPTTLFAGFSRLTRFFSKHKASLILERLCKQLKNCLVPYKSISSAGLIVFSTVDKMKCPLSGEIKVQLIRDSISLVLFTKSKGDALEFKRFFRFLLQELADIIVDENEMADLLYLETTPFMRKL